MKFFIILAAVLFSSLTSFAARESNCGMGVYINDQLRFFDLVEYRAHNEVRLSPEPPSARRLKVVRQTTPAEFPHELIAQSMDDIARFSGALGGRLTGRIPALTWSFTNDELEITDDYLEIINRDRWYYYNVVQIAHRKGNHITINRPLWSQLSTRDKAALIIHEMIYSILDKYSAQGNSTLTRNFVGLLYSQNGYEMLLIDASLREKWYDIFGINTPF